MDTKLDSKTDIQKITFCRRLRIEKQSLYPIFAKYIDNCTKRDEKFLETIKLPTCIKRDAVRSTYRNNILQARLKKTASYSVVKSLQVNG
jgi:hypothetical protein